MNRSWMAYAPGVLVVLALAATSLTASGLVVHRYFHDTFVVFDAMWRAALGQTPHIDFPSPIGQAYYWPFRLLSWFGEIRVTTLLQANAIVAVTVVTLACISLPRRLSPLFFALATLTIGTMAMTPRDLDGWIDSYSFLAPYNTWAWALVVIPALISMVPPAGRVATRTTLIDGAVLGVALALLFYLKITFFAPAMGFLVLGAALRHLPLTSAGAAIATAITIGAIVELTAHNNAAYIRDLQLVAQVNLEGDRGVRSDKLLKSIALAGVFGAAFLTGIWLWQPATRAGAWVLRMWRPIFIAAAILGAGAAIASQNHPKLQLTLVGIGLIAGGELARRKLRQEAQAPREKPSPLARAGAVGGWLLILAPALAAPLLDSVSIVGQAIESHSDRVCEIPSLDGDRLLVRRLAPRLEGKPVGAPTCEWIKAADAEPFFRPGSSVWERRTLDEIQRLEEGLTLLRRTGNADSVILAADFSNPYPMLFRRQPPVGAAIWWDYGRDYSAEHHPPAAPMLGSATVVLRADNHLAGRNFWEVYGADIERDFRKANQTARWSLWVREDPVDGRSRRPAR